MAGELVASVVVDGLLSKLRSGLWSELGLLWSLKDDLEDMKTTLLSVQAVLSHAEKRSFTDEPVRLWLKRLKAAAYDIDDMFDKFQTQNRLLYSPVMAHKLKGMRKRLDKIAEERSRYNLIKEEAISYEKEVIEERKTTSVVFKDDVLGRDQEATQIINRLLVSTPTNESTALSIIPIVGIGGLGKTTLAKLIYNDDRIKEVFNPRIWVHAVNLEVENLVEAIVSSQEDENRNNLSNFDSKMTKAKKILKEKRYLIVLDDVWSEDWQKWDAFKQILQCSGKRESKIIVTTRSDRVPSIMGAETTHILQPLSDDDCLKLFNQRAFGSADAKDNHLASIGEEIVKKCRGVPLTANSLGGMLHFEKGEAAWKKIRDNDLWELKEEEGGGSHSENKIMSSLKLSYQHMPSALKLCFVYCSFYPKAFKLDKDMLIQQWVAQRFIQTEDEVEALQIGDGYVNYLLSISFLEKEEQEEETYMKMHDLVYDLARWVAGDEVSLLDAEESRKDNAMECRYASVIKSNESSKELGKALPRKVRALHFQDCTSLPKGIFSYTKCLRVLDFTGCFFGELPTSIYKLKQLRCLRLPDHLTEVDEEIGKLHNLIYLEIYARKLSQIPYSIGSLQKLNYLKLVGRNMLRSLPESQNNLEKLETLDSRQCSRFERIPESLGNLVKLATLTIYNCGSLESLPESLCNLMELAALTIYNCEALTSLPESLGNLVKLETLDIRQCSRLESIPESLGNLVKLETLDIRQCSRLEGIPESLGNLMELAALTIYNCEALTSLPESLGNLVKLETLDIRQCSRLESIPESLGNLVKLATLTIYNCESLESLPESLCNLKELATLTIYNCEALTSLPKSLGNLVKLTTLTIYNCKALTSLPDSLGNLVKLETLDIRQCPRLQRIPESLGNLKLARLTIYNCEALRSLPESLGNLVKLATLTINSCEAVTRLPESLGNLVKLETLDIRKCYGLERLPESLGNLVKLETLTIYDCRAIRSLPESLSNLVNLKTLAIGKLSNFTLLAFIRKLHNLIYLDLSFSDELLEIPDSIERLQKLNSLKLYGCDNLRSLPESLGNLKKLRTLDIRRCAMLDQYELPTAICNMRHLKFQRDEPSKLFEFDTSDLMLQFIDGYRGGHVVCHVTDAKRINLKERGGSIKSLTYRCAAYHKKGRLVEAMLEALQPHQNLQELYITNYEGSMFPSWMMSQMDSFLPNLVKIELKYISSCKHLPVLGQLPKLEVIVANNIGKIRRISEEELCGARNTTAGASFPSLKRLELRGMWELEEWVTAAMAGDDGERGASLFPCLEDLTISNCYKLRRIHPCIPPSVRRLSLSGIAKLHLLTFPGVPEIPLLKHLDIEDYGLDSFPESIRHLTFLETLELRGCKSLTTFPEWLGELSQLQHLEIIRCPLIDDLPQRIQGLTALKRLHITQCSESLWERTRKETGEDWDKISHIDNIQITRDY